jgi:hypothetical protein
MLRKVVLFTAFLLLLGQGAFADVFGTDKSNIIQVGEPKLSYAVSSETVINAGAALIEKLGIKEGVACEIKSREVVNLVGGTFFTYSVDGKEYINFATDLVLLGSSSLGVALDYNIGAALPVDNVPVLAYVKYLHFNVGTAYDLNGYSWKPFLGLQYKFNFNL